MDNLNATVTLFSGMHRNLGILSNVTLVSARVNANAMINSVGDGAYAVINAPGVEEVMHATSELDSWYFPLADISHMVAVPFTPNDRLARHFQMAGAVDQATVEFLVRAFKRGVGPAEFHRFKTEFLIKPIGGVPQKVLCADGCTNTIRLSAITDAERDVYRNSNQYADPVR